MVRTFLLTTVLLSGGNNARGAIGAGEQTIKDQSQSVASEYTVRLDIPAKGLGPAISPLLFGHNLEITRKASWKGLSAEVLANRKFAAVGTNGFPLHWTAIETHKGSVTRGSPSTVTLDSIIAYAGKNSLRVALNDEGGERGIYQQHERLTLVKGRRYRFHVWVRADAPVRVVVRVRAPTGGQTNSPLFEGKRGISPAG